MASVELHRHSGKFAERQCRRAGASYRAAIPYEPAPSSSCRYHRGEPASARPAISIRRPKILKRLKKSPVTTKPVIP